MTNNKSPVAKILFLIRKSPYGTSHNKEALDAILAALTLDMHVSVVFLDEGVWQLKSEQKPQAIQEKNYTATFKVMPQYGDVNIYIESESLTERSLSVNDLIINPYEVNRKSITQLIAQQDILLSF
jgi:tRNA 2-thiouridine synthesizing protein C